MTTGTCLVSSLPLRRLLSSSKGAPAPLRRSSTLFLFLSRLADELVAAAAALRLPLSFFSAVAALLLPLSFLSALVVAAALLLPLSFLDELVAAALLFPLSMMDSAFLLVS